jgi:hypothetical protein
MNITESRNLKKIITVRNTPWLQRNRYSQPITDLYNECNSSDHLWIVSKLIQDFNFIDSERYVDEVTKMANFMMSQWKLLPKDTLVTAISESSKPDGSQAVIRTLEVNLPINWKHSIHNNINVAFSSPKKNIVLVDDFVGSGEKLSLKLKRLMTHLESNGHESTIYLLTLGGMNSGLQMIRHTLGGNVYCPISMKRAISDNIMEPLERAKAVNAMIELEQKILPLTPYPRNLNFIEYNFGYLLSESIFFVETLNIPNNVFPIFWREFTNANGKKGTRNSMFRRR